MISAFAHSSPFCRITVGVVFQTRSSWARFLMRQRLERVEKSISCVFSTRVCSSAQGNPPTEAVAGREGHGGGFFEGCLAKSRSATPAEQRFWLESIYEHIRELMPLQGRLSIEHMCQLVAVSRRGFYRSLRQRAPAEEETEVRSLIQRIYLEHRRRYGCRRITAELHRRGVQVNRKKVARMMRDDNLLAIQPKRFMVTTNSRHDCEVYLNLVCRMRLTGINQLWVADLTYVRLRGEFAYLAVILDSFSRKVVGWALDRTLMSSRLTVVALERAVAHRQPPAGLVHHSDRGLQYASPEYVTALARYGMVASMSRPATPFDNASCESFIKTRKREEIYANRYDGLEQLRANIEEFIDEYYNRQRLHSTLGYRSPEEFEKQSERAERAESLCATMRFGVNAEGNVENGEWASTGLSEEGDSNAVPFLR
jgi:transposase InsO family protein